MKNNSLLRLFFSFFVILLIGSSFAQETKDEKEPPIFALLVGINKYPKLAPDYQLNGSLNDVALFQEMLCKRFAIPQKNITVLCDEQATRDGILGQFAELLKKVKESGPGTQIIFFYSGHGSQVEDKNEDEDDDGKDETLVTYNSTMSDNGEEDIIDDEIEIFLQNLSDLQAYSTVIFDCCHSGTALRGATAKARFLPRKLKSVRGNIKISEKKATPGVIFISACQAEQITEEHEPMNDGKSYGLLTYHLTQSIEKEGVNSTYRSVFKRLQDIYKNQVNPTFFKKGNFDPPIPCIEGDISRLLFGRKALKGSKYAKVTSSASINGRKTIDNGTFLGITEGSIFCLVPNVDKIPLEGELESNHILVIVEQVTLFESTIRPLKPEERELYKESIPTRFLQDKGNFEDVSVEWECVELLHASDETPLKLYLEKELAKRQKDNKIVLSQSPLEKKELPPNVEQSLKKLEEQKIIKLVSKAEEADVILKMGQRIGVFVWANAEKNSSIFDENMVLEQFEPSGFTAFSLGEEKKNILPLEETLDKFNTIKNLLKLQISETPLETKVSLVKIKKDERNKWVPNGEIKPNSEEVLQIEAGELFGFLFENKSEEDLYPTFIYISNNLEIQILYPSVDQNDYAVVSKRNKLVPVRASVSQTIIGKDTLKLLVTKDPIQLHALETSSLEYYSHKKMGRNKKTKEDYFFEKFFGRTDLSRMQQRNLGVLIDEEDPQWSIKTLHWKIIEKK